MNIKGKIIDILGDSIAEGAMASSPLLSFPSLLSRQYGAIVNNYGIGGARIARQSNSKDEYYPYDFNFRATSMDKNADIIIIFGGTNDFGHGDAAIGDEKDTSVYTFCGALNTLIMALKNTYSKAKIIFITPLERSNMMNPYGSGYKEKPGALLYTYVNIIIKKAKENNCLVLDLFHDSDFKLDQNGYNPNLFDDMLHPNDMGHALIAKKIVDFIQKEL